MIAYYKKPEDTAEAIDSNGYFHTGDAGFFDNDGHLKIIDRAKDVGKMAERLGRRPRSYADFAAETRAQWEA
jgi:acyl-CoA synthetase (AMP-forming)/AMP-acid ligase II